MFSTRSRRWLAAIAIAAIAMVGDYFIQTRIPPENPADTTRQTFWYRATTWTVPPEGQRDAVFILYSAFDFAVAASIMYLVLSRWQRKREDKHVRT